MEMFAFKCPDEIMTKTLFLSRVGLRPLTRPSLVDKITEFIMVRSSDIGMESRRNPIPGTSKGRNAISEKAKTKSKPKLRKTKKRKKSSTSTVQFSIPASANIRTSPCVSVSTNRQYGVRTRRQGSQSVSVVTATQKVAQSQPEIRKNGSTNNTTAGTTPGKSKAPVKLSTSSSSGNGNKKNYPYQGQRLDQSFREGFYLVDKILDCRDEPDGSRKYYIKWQGYPSESNTWEPKENITEDLIASFEKTLGKFQYQVPPPQDCRTVTLNPMNSTILSSASPLQLQSGIATTVVTALSTEVLVPRRRRRANNAQDSEEIQDSVTGTTSINSGCLSFRRPPVRYDQSGFHILETDTNVAEKSLQEIIGLTSYRDEIIFVVKFKDEDSYMFVNSATMNTSFPQDVVQFYEYRIFWLNNT